MEKNMETPKGRPLEHLKRRRVPLGPRQGLGFRGLQAMVRADAGCRSGSRQPRKGEYGLSRPGGNFW